MYPPPFLPTHSRNPFLFCVLFNLYIRMHILHMIEHVYIMYLAKHMYIKKNTLLHILDIPVDDYMIISIYSIHVCVCACEYAWAMIKWHMIKTGFRARLQHHRTKPQISNVSNARKASLKRHTVKVNWKNSALNITKPFALPQNEGRIHCLGWWYV